jgi:phosphatidate cytidylyltransferase
MAFNWQTFRTRAGTAVIFVIVMLGGLLWNKWSFFALFTLVHFGAWVEYGRLVEKFNPDYARIGPLHRYGVMIGGWCAMLFFTNGELQVGAYSLAEIGLWGGILFAVLLPVAMMLETRSLFLKNIGYSLFGLLYISIALALLMDLRQHSLEFDLQVFGRDQYWGLQPSLFLVLFLVVSIWINDTMAYIVGSLIGKTPFSPISPKKTWEGTIGGAILCVVVMTLIGYSAGFPLLLGIGISLLAAVVGTLGDLFESKLKRMAGVKDSGQLMPGHGGFLDRFDSLIVAVTAVWLFVWITRI